MDNLVSFLIAALIIGFFHVEVSQKGKKNERNKRTWRQKKESYSPRVQNLSTRILTPLGNQVTLSYRKEGFSRIKERNAQRIQESIRKGKVKVVFNSNPLEFKNDSVVLEVNGKPQEIPNIYVWIFAGGEPPTAFLKKIGVGFGAQDLTSTASREARAAREAKQTALTLL